MTPQEKIKELAELDSFNFRYGFQANHFNGKWCCGDMHGSPINVPGYLESYDAIIPLIRKVCNDALLKRKFIFELFKILGLSEDEPWSFDKEFACIAEATPLQLSDALLIATGRMR